MVCVVGRLTVNVDSFGNTFRQSVGELDDAKLEDADPYDLFNGERKR
jgi:hypothetical protein